jgi:membrane protein required for colicin V production
MNWADWGMLIILVASISFGVSRGFVKETLSLVVWFIAFWIAFLFSDQLAGHLSMVITNPTLQRVIAFLLLLIVTLIFGGLVNRLVVTSLHRSGLGFPDRALGLVFGFVRALLLICILLYVISLTPLTDMTWWKTSKLIPYFHAVTDWIKQLGSGFSAK